MQFKDDRVRAEYYQTPTLLQIICADFEEECHKIGVDPCVTRVFEHVPGDSGVHEAHRAVDFRDEHAGAFTFNDEQRAGIAKTINAKYPRNDHKPTLLFHSFVSPVTGQRSPLHCHIQQALNPKVYVLNKEEG